MTSTVHSAREGTPLLKRCSPSVRLIAGLLLFITAIAGPARAEEDPPGRRFYQSPLFWGGSLTLATLLADRSIHEGLSIQDKKFINKTLGNGRYGRPGTFVEMMGQPTLILPLSGLFYGVGVVRHDARARRVGRAGAVATLGAGGTALLIKFAVGRNRPYTGNDVDEFRPFQNTRTSGTSFPSGHAAVSFSMATVIAQEYADWRVDALSYGAASAVALSRIYQDRHWASDVVGGATLGFVIGKWAWKRSARGGASLATDGRRVYWVRRF